MVKGSSCLMSGQRSVRRAEILGTRRIMIASVSKKADTYTAGENMLLEVKNLKVEYHTRTKVSYAVKGVSFSMKRGDILGIVGESGSGKSTMGLALMMQLPSTAKFEGNVIFKDKDLVPLTFDEIRKIKGKEISTIFQEPMTSLNPLIKVGKQVEEILKIHDKTLSKAVRRDKVLRMFRNVELQNPEEVYNKYPHELSGGMQQRVMIAMALMNHPDLLIADEPTTALDADVQDQILELLKSINSRYGTSIILISHDLRVVRQLCRRTLVMYKGEIVEEGDVEQIFENPRNDYTKSLVNAFTEEIKEKRPASDDNMLEVRDLTLFYKIKSGKPGQKPGRKYICQNMSFTVKRGEITGLVGPSGIGKSSVSRAILGLHKDYTGEIILKEPNPQMIFQDSASSLNPGRRIGWILEEPLKNLKTAEQIAHIRQISHVQELLENSSDTVGQSRRHVAGHAAKSCAIVGSETRLSRAERKAIARHMLARVELPEEFLNRYPRELSGGQKQRVNIALALIAGSSFVIADEPVSALDVTIQDQILKLLLQLQKELNLSMLFISHDRAVVARVCDDIVDLGQWIPR